MRLVITSSVAKKTFGSVEMAPNRLHNFSLPPLWGHQRLLRCVKDIYSASDHHHNYSNNKSNCKHDRDWDIDTDQRSPKKAKTSKDVSDLDEGIEVAREKSMVVLVTKTAVEDVKIEEFERDVESEIAEEEKEVTVAVLPPQNAFLKNCNANKTAAMDSNQRSSKKANRKSDICNKAVCDLDEGIEAMREKLMVEIRTVAENMKIELIKQGVENEIAEEENEVTVRNAKYDISKNRAAVLEMAAAEKQWNMRTRRSAACKELNTKRAEFSLALSMKEIDGDFRKIIGRKPPCYPKKRPKAVQNDLDKSFPGTYFKEVRHDMYN